MISTLHLYLTTTSIRARIQSGLLWKKNLKNIGQWEWHGQNLDTFPADVLTSYLNKNNDKSTRKIKHLHLYVGSGLCKWMMCQLPAHLQNDAEKIAAAQAQMTHLLGLNANEWTCAIDTTHASPNVVVCAVRISLMEHLKLLCAQHDIKLMMMRPYIDGIWNAFQTRQSNTTHAALLIWEEDAYTLVVANAGVIQSIHALLHQHDTQLIEREIKRLNVSNGTNKPLSLYVAGMDSSAQVIASRFGLNPLMAMDDQKPSELNNFSDLMFIPITTTKI